jgi:hypothetical protein
MDVSLCPCCSLPFQAFCHSSGARLHFAPPPPVRPAVCGVFVQLGRDLVVPGHLQWPHLRPAALVRLHPARLHQRGLQHSPGERVWIWRESLT